MTSLLLAGINDWLHRVWFKPANSDLALNPDGSLKFAGVDWVFMFILWVSIISFIIIVVPMCWWAWKYRRRPGFAAQRTPNHNTLLEVTWVVVPLVVLVFIFFWGFHGYMAAQVARGDALTILITGQKWNWAATYPNGATSGETKFLDDMTMPAAKQGGQRGNQGVPVLIVPEGVPVRFRMTSTDVIHSFFIPDMRVKMDVFPNRYTSYTFTPIRATAKTASGQYQDHVIYCAEYCGTNHSEMAALLRVLPVSEYNQVVEEWGNVMGKMHEEKKPMWELGKWVYESQGCRQCHSIDGSKNTGPSWKGFYGKDVPLSREGGEKFSLTTEDGWANYIRESIIYPQRKIHAGYEAGNMNSYAGQLTEFQISGVIEYFKHLNGVKTDATVPDPKTDRKTKAD
ncbi:MAG: c-type cytochrome [Phycisphaeraceae bacterium]|nr:c-type cytochrome [Phycisphaeraceae bacterium]